jgi:flagellar basal body-associated protein FliL
MRINKNIAYLATYGIALGLFIWVGYYSYADYTLRARYHEQSNTQTFQTDMAYIDLPHIAVTLSSINATGRPNSLRMEITLEVEDQFAAQLVGYQPRITDRLIHYMEKMDYDDIVRPHSSVWLKPDMLAEVNKASAPVPVHDLVFKEFIVL